MDNFNAVSVLAVCTQVSLIADQSSVMSTPRRIVDSLYGLDSLYIDLNYLLHCLFLL